MYDDYDYEPRQATEDFLALPVQFLAQFSIGVAATFLIRMFSQLQPLYWLVLGGGIAALSVAIWQTRQVRWIVLLSCLLGATFAGHYDHLVHVIRSVQ